MTLKNFMNLCDMHHLDFKSGRDRISANVFMLPLDYLLVGKWDRYVGLDEEEDILIFQSLSSFSINSYLTQI